MKPPLNTVLEAENATVAPLPAKNEPVCVASPAKSSVPLLPKTVAVFVVGTKSVDVPLPPLFTRRPFGATVSVDGTAQLQPMLPSAWRSNVPNTRSEEHTSELQSPYVIS